LNNSPARRAGAVGAVGQLVGLGPGGRDQILDRLDRGFRIDHDNAEGTRHQRDGREIAVLVVGQFGVKARIDRIGEGAHQERITIALTGRDRLRADDGARARLVLDDDGDAEVLCQLLCQRARHHIGAAARREWHHDLDDPLWIGRAHAAIGQHRQRACCKREQERAQFDSGEHVTAIAGRSVTP
jgi:hypothetical protein